MIIKLENLKSIREKHPNQKIVFCGGVFDLLHNGHIEYLEEVKSMGDILVLGVSSDKRVKERKGENRPIHNQETRAKIIDAIRYVDYTLIAPDPNENETIPTMAILKMLKPDLFVSHDERWLDFKDKILDLGINLEVIEINRVNSTTSVIEKIKNISK